ncbi:hypothetical protein Moror_12942 [Moniliophthora roreri MCA 2997]|uniref:Uncharacterized protein n=1 Tax=Moniliophthora roreri (strain MCA 2997) TaxID=1381753 RepID=V2YQJ2_MONRO|nr:hypothetical protein Moror_12942 [Moniliophthora roreri MCA 2997]
MHIPFDDAVDPKGYLEQLYEGNYVHTSKNQVVYFKRSTNTAGEQHFTETTPSKLQEGDIVEVQFTMTMVKTHNRHRTSSTNDGYKTRLVLHAVTLLDSTFSEVSNTPLQIYSPLIIFSNVNHLQCN